MTKLAAGLVGVLLVVHLAVIIAVGHYETRSAQHREMELARNALDAQGLSLAAIAVDYSTWTDALQHMVIEFDADWAERNIGEWLRKNFAIDMAFIINADGRPVFVSADVPANKSADSPRFSADIASALDALRPGTASMSGLVSFEGTPAIAAIAPVASDEGTVPPGVAPHFLLLVQLLRPTVLDTLAETHGLPDLAFGSSGTVSIPLVSENGQTIGELSWEGNRPGDTMMHFAVPLWALLAVGFALLMRQIVRQANTATRMIEASEHRASHDPLTGLPNRAGLIHRLETSARMCEANGGGFSILYLDLDGFKTINDTHGHETGDRVLKAVANRMRYTLSDLSYASRLSGDEFVIILLAQTEPSPIHALATGLIAAIESPIQIDDTLTVEVSATIGVATATRNEADPIHLLRHADAALYFGKKNGKGRVYFPSPADEDRLAEKTVEASKPRAAHRAFNQ
ncbi:diguanylate cyclase [Fulvimarina sp. MAC8]|uniref:diguanylate cyclase domain-containing protein n=1 Tax=Fulvimarina sp. MAC8 TaxID=3162874 RepID=UPI0032EAD435